MAGILDSVNQLTQLVGRNRLELLIFRLPGSSQLYGINVFKVREVIRCPHLSIIPRQHKYVRGAAHIRGQTIAVIDMGLAISDVKIEDLNKSFIIISECSRTVQGFLVSGVDRIVDLEWSQIKPPPHGTGTVSNLTAITEVDGELVEIIDVEKILNEITPSKKAISQEVVKDIVPEKHVLKRCVLVADDSRIALKQVVKVMDSIHVESVTAKNGKEAYDKLMDMAKSGHIYDDIGLVISDVEMPEMDGYTLTAKIRSTPSLSNLMVILHTSLSGVFNVNMVKQVGADGFIAKFNPEELARKVEEMLDIREKSAQRT